MIKTMPTESESSTHAAAQLPVPQFTAAQVIASSIEYFDGDEMAATTFANKYALQTSLGGLTPYCELNPNDMHDRIARELHRIESKYPNPRKYKEFRKALQGFEKIVPQGSPMYGIGNPYAIVSLSNCVVVESPEDNMSSIFESGKELANLYKRRAGVGLSLDTLRPENAPVSNAAKASTGAWSFADFYSNVTRMVGQAGRRGALMLTMNMLHPDVHKFIGMKQDIGNVTGANVSVMLGDSFMNAATTPGAEWITRWSQDKNIQMTDEEVEELLALGGEWVYAEIKVPVLRDTDETHPVLNTWTWKSSHPDFPRLTSFRKFQAAELWEFLNRCARNTAEPGLLFWDNYGRELPANYYPGFKSTSTNPCCFAQSQDVYVLTRHGYKNIQTLMPLDEVWSESLNKWVTTSTGYFEAGEAQVYEVKFSNGDNLFVTSNHKFPLVRQSRKGSRTEHRFFEMVDVSALQVGDKIMSQTSRPEGIIWGTMGSRNEGLMMGWLSGDGCLCYKPGAKNPAVTLDFWKDEHNVFEQILKAIQDEYSLDISGWKFANNQNDVMRISSSRITDCWGDKHQHNIWEFKGGYNSFLDQCSEEFAKAYLAAYFTADGTISAVDTQSRWAIQLVSVDEDRLRQVRRMLACFGIKSSITPLNRESEWSKRKAYRLSITGRTSLVNFASEIGFVSNKKQARLENVVKRVSAGKFEKQQNYAKIVSITCVGYDTVGCIEVPEGHQFTVEEIVSGNSEIALSPYDSCRLTSLNLKGFVKNPFTPDAYFDFEEFAHYVRLGMRVMDNIVDLEIECLQNIINMIAEEDEKILWGKLLNAAQSGRRTGLGTHALGDALACLCLRYDSDEAIAQVNSIYNCLRDNAYRESVNLAKERGCFPVYNWETEKGCPFIQRLPNDITEEMKQFGRRNISLLTNAPTGSVSIVSRTSSGIEPTFRHFYVRRQKINPNDADARVDFKDASGDSWQHFDVFERNMQEFFEFNPDIKAQWDEIYHNSPHKEFSDNMQFWTDELNKILPDYFVYAEMIDPLQRVRLQGVLQSYIDHGVSSTINMNKDVTSDYVREIYEEAWRCGLKGVTVYRDKSRSGVLVTSADSQVPTGIIEHDAPKRPEILPCHIERATVEGEKWTIFVGLLDGQPYEIFGGLAENIEIPKKYTTGYIRKRKCEKRENTDETSKRKACYDLIAGDDDDPLIVKDVVINFNDDKYGWGTRMLSTMLRHGVPLRYIVEQLRRSYATSLHSFNKAMARVLAKYDEADGTGEIEKPDNCRTGNCE